jgi:hypothetical protein
MARPDRAAASVLVGFARLLAILGAIATVPLLVLTDGPLYFFSVLIARCDDALESLRD